MEPQAIDPARLNAFKKNLEYLSKEAQDITGLPLDVMLGQVYINANQRALPAQGIMHPSGQFVPNEQTLHEWIDDYFTRALAPQNDMPEA